MSEERSASTPSGIPVAVKSEDKSAANELAAKLAKRKELKAKIAQVLDRGFVTDRLHVDLPEGVHGQWVRNDKMEISRLQTIGWEVDTKYALKQALNTEGGNAVVGDVVYMTCDAEVHELMEEVRKERFYEQHVKTQEEDTQFAANIQSLGEGISVLPEKSSMQIRSPSKTE